MSKPSLLVQNIEQRVPNAALRLSAEKQISKLLNRNQLLVGIVVFVVLALVCLFVLSLGTDSARSIFFIAVIPILVVVAKVAPFFKDRFYRRQLEKLGRSVGELEKDTPLVVSTIDGRGYLEIKDGILHIIQTKGSIKQMNISEVINVECIYYENHSEMYAFFSSTEVICFSLIDDTNKATQREASTNSTIAMVEINKMNMTLKADFMRRLSAYNHIKVNNNSVNKAHTEISAGMSTLIIIIFSIVAILIVATISMQANN